MLNDNDPILIPKKAVNALKVLLMQLDYLLCEIENNQLPVKDYDQAP